MICISSATQSVNFRFAVFFALNAADVKLHDEKAIVGSLEGKLVFRLKKQRKITRVLSMMKEASISKTDVKEKEGKDSKDSKDLKDSQEKEVKEGDEKPDKHERRARRATMFVEGLINRKKSKVFG